MRGIGRGVARWINGATPASRLLLIAAACAALAIVPPATLDRLPRFCLWQRLFGYCPACGTTRALSALLHGDPARAVAYNANVIVVAPLLAGIAAHDIYRLCSRQP